MNKSILVIGATGMLGAPVANQLHREGYQVRVLARKPDKARDKLGDSFEYFQGDVEDAASLEPALDGCFGVHISLRGGPAPSSFDRIEHIGTANVAAAARKAGVQQLTYLSGAADFEKHIRFPMAKAKMLAEEAIVRSGVPYTIFKATHFMESLPLYIRGKRATVIGRQSHLLHWVSANDYAKMVSNSFQIPEAKNKRFFIHGPEPMTIGQALAKYCSAVRPEIKLSSLPIWLLALVGGISFNAEIKFAAQLMSFFEEAGEAGDPAAANQLLGAPTTTLDEWCRQ